MLPNHLSSSFLRRPFSPGSFSSRFFSSEYVLVNYSELKRLQFATFLLGCLSGTTTLGAIYAANSLFECKKDMEVLKLQARKDKMMG